MDFTRYYERLISTKGLPNLDVDNHRKIMNIVSIGSRLDELKNLSKNDKYRYEKRLYHLRISELEKTLSFLIKSVPVEDFSMKYF